MADLTMEKRKKLKSSQFALPGKGEGEGGKGSGSYPIPDEEHARLALSMSSGKPEEDSVRAAVHKKFPNIGKSNPTHGSGKLTAMGSKTLGALQDKHGAAEGRKRFHAAMSSGKLNRERMMASDSSGSMKGGQDSPVKSKQIKKASKSG